MTSRSAAVAPATAAGRFAPRPAGTTAAEALHVTRVRPDGTILVRGGSGAVGVSVLRQARLIGAHRRPGPPGGVP